MTVKVHDAGNNWLISGDTKEAVQLKLAELGHSDASVAQNGKVWVASIENPHVMASECTVEDFAANIIITGKSRAAVEGKLSEARDRGANPVSKVVQDAGGKWFVVCDKSGFRGW